MHVDAGNGLTLDATDRSIGVELLTAESGTATVTVNGRPYLPLWRIGAPTDGHPPGHYGKLFPLEPGTQYDVQVTVAGQQRGGTITTERHETPSADSLTPTHYVYDFGSDAADGLTQQTAWRTLQKAVTAAPSGAVVAVGIGLYVTPTTARTLPLTLVANFPALDVEQQPINQGNRSIVYGFMTLPGENKWQLVMPDGDISHRLWKLSGHGVKAPTQMGWHSIFSDAPQRISNWKPDARQLGTAAGFAGLLYSNKSHNHGFWVEPGTGAIYLRLPPNAPSNDPNQLCITLGGSVSLAFNGPGMRVSGLEFRCFSDGLQLLEKCDRPVVDHCLFVGNRQGLKVFGKKPGIYGSDAVTDHCLFVDSNLYLGPDAGNDVGIPRDFIKGRITLADGSEYGSARVGEQNESSGIRSQGGSRNAVVRDCTFDGLFNGLSLGDGYDRYQAYNNDWHDLTLRNIADNSLEPENQVVNLGAWDCRSDHVLNEWSAGPVKYGPVYLLRCNAFDIGPDGLAKNAMGDPGASGSGLKYSGSSSPPALLVIVNCSLVTYQDGVPGAGQYAGGGSNQEFRYERNNIFRFTREAWRLPGGGKVDEDYNHWATSNAAQGMEAAGRTYRDPADYRAATGQGAHTNLLGDFITPDVIDTALTDPRAGDLTLPPGSPFIGAGIAVPGLSDSTDLGGYPAQVLVQQVCPRCGGTGSVLASA